MDLFYLTYDISLSIIVFGLFTFGLFSIIMMLANGYVVGIVIGEVLQLRMGVLLLTGLAPHFFTETLSLFLCSTVGSATGLQLFRWLRGIQLIPLKCLLLETIMITTFSVFLLFISAFIESNISYVRIKG
ncbi:MAG: hypothetical protein BLM47_11405 [Candidatus Reconcilbacillus cellulovorans]|uniref:Stage II sporulation protein M n=1 Tax=Candidatus Reconcilbacillus cellulovorans TaxID=1906605 RepID=A0A2A6DY32_9BACL|nr:MAG: hypothetical protein BLM47_11405 [Candidatus Reconcilbacillus cellulovorans]